VWEITLNPTKCFFFENNNEKNIMLKLKIKVLKRKMFVGNKTTLKAVIVKV
jgi:hypothetical protein